MYFKINTASVELWFLKTDNAYSVFYVEVNISANLGLKNGLSRPEKLKNLTFSVYET